MNVCYFVVLDWDWGSQCNTLLQELFLPPPCIILTARPRVIWSDKLWSVSLVWVGRKHGIMAKPDMYADIDFDEINEATNLAADEIKCLKVGNWTPLSPSLDPRWPQVCFDLFDTKKQDFLSADDLGKTMVIHHQLCSCGHPCRGYHEGHGLQTYRRGTQGAPDRDRRGRIRRNWVRRVLPTVRYILRKVETSDCLTSDWETQH